MARWAVAIGTCVGLAAGPVFGQQMTGDEIKAMIGGKTVDTSGGAISYKADGKYEYYSKSDGRSFRGKWSIRGNEVCVDFESGDKRCDQYIKDGNKVSLRNSRGQLFPVSGVK